jgi:H+/Cl- antiporter ClcA
MPTDEALEELKKNFVGIVATIVVGLQCALFSYLVIQLPPILNFFQSNLSSPGSWLLILELILCLAILFRVIQTYLTAAIDYKDWVIGPIDIFVIIILTVAQGYLISTLVPNNTDIKAFYIALSFITFIASIGYFQAFSKLKPDNKNYFREKQLQTVNILGVFIPFLITLIIIIGPRLDDIIYVVFNIIISVIVWFNIYYSLRITFINEPPLINKWISRIVKSFWKNNTTFDPPPPPNSPP